MDNKVSSGTIEVDMEALSRRYLKGEIPLPKKYCRTCGALVLGKLKFTRFDSDTGKKLFVLLEKCPQEKWWHSIHDVDNLFNDVDIPGMMSRKDDYSLRYSFIGEIDPQYVKNYKGS